LVFSKNAIFSPKTGENRRKSNGHKIYQHLPSQHPAKFTQIGIFGLKTNYLAYQDWTPAALQTSTVHTIEKRSWNS
jgi:hypothetical protein